MPRKFQLVVAGKAPAAMQRFDAAAWFGFGLRPVAWKFQVVAPRRLTAVQRLDGAIGAARR